MLETPSAQNPFGSGGAAFACLSLDGTVAPFAPAGVSEGSRGLSVGHGWVALPHPLTPGTHTIVITVGGQAVTTTTVVVPGG